MIARKVEKPPWKTEEPIPLIALRALNLRLSALLRSFGALIVR